MTTGLEVLAKAMHEAWLEAMAEQGWHPPHRLGSMHYETCAKCRQGLGGAQG